MTRPMLLALLGFSEALNCPQLPDLAPTLLADGATHGSPPQDWKCDPDKYFQLDGVHPEDANCDCGCGVIDPDCGFVLPNCQDQRWEPKYKDLVCNGAVSARDQLYCRLESATCQALPPGLQFNRTDWTCIPDVYNELSDSGTSLNDCDCNCGGLDPDCMGTFDNIYCPDDLDSAGNPVPVPWGQGVECGVHGQEVTCQRQGDWHDYVPPSCPQIPPSSPREISTIDGVDYHWGNTPPGWTCDPSLYYETDSAAGHTPSDHASCDCGCGVIDPDCGFSLEFCEDQTWNPTYTSLTCDGQTADAGVMYCRLESATCQVLAPGLQRGATTEWNCIPDVYSEMTDPGTSLNNCDCNCGGMDPDCIQPFNDIYCPGVLTDDGFPLALPRSQGVECAVTHGHVGCERPAEEESADVIQCPHLPPMTPAALAHGRGWNTPPLGWSCDAALYFQLDGVHPEDANCDCGCGVIDPDCGFVLPSCQDQRWEPKYKDLVCNDVVSPRDQLYCRLDSAICQALPPGLQSGRTDWTCIPDVYNELSDPGTSLNDCDCNCGGLDPDCMGNFDQMYCPDELDSAGNPVPIQWGKGVECGVTDHNVSCMRSGDGTEYVAPNCPQLPPSSPAQISTIDDVTYTFGNPPPAWTCDASLYYEMDSGSIESSCDCGCGVIDPDCGYALVSCDDQTWNPSYQTLTCEGKPVDADLLYCRLESATCQVLPPGLQRGSTSEWNCIPDVYSEMSDPGHSLNNCDCNCGGMDPDCFQPFNDIYCPGQLSDDGAALPFDRSIGVQCAAHFGVISCENIPIKPMPVAISVMIAACFALALVWFSSQDAKKTALTTE